MSVTAIGAYEHATHDTADHFSAPLLYVAWDEHMLFAAPAVLPVSMHTTMTDVQSKLFPSLYSEHPDYERIQWAQVQWFCGDKMFTPQPNKTLAEHGFTHKSVLRFRTPGLEGLRGSCG